MPFGRAAILFPLACMIAACAAAQTAASGSPAQAAPYTLHVYANRIQVPAMILHEGEPVAGLHAKDVEVTLDGGPSFAPTSLRVEGNDPLHVAVLLDATGDTRTLLEPFAAAFSHVAASAMNPHDTVSLYAMDCGLYRSADAHSVLGLDLQRAFSNLLSMPALHNGKKHGACANTLAVWDSIAQVASAMENLPGRRVLIVVGEARSGKSHLDGLEAARITRTAGVAIFGFRDSFIHASRRDLDSILDEHEGPFHDFGRDPLASMAGRNGGYVVTDDPVLFGEALATLFRRLRARYIVEFPRPEKETAGLHGIHIATRGVRTSVLVTGASAALPDPALDEDPTTVKSTPSPAVMGTKRPKS